MAVYYLDASAVVKYFHMESGTTWVRQVVDGVDNNSSPSNKVYIAEITRVEVPAAFALLERTRQISLNLRDRMYRAFLQKSETDFKSLSLTAKIIRRAATLTQQHPLKAYDAVQLATAIDLNALFELEDFSSIFVTSDKTLLQAAEAEGLQADNPLNHA